MTSSNLPETRFAQSGNVSIAYQVMGDVEVEPRSLDAGLVGFNVLFVSVGITLLAVELRDFGSLLADIEAVRVAAFTGERGE